MLYLAEAPMGGLHLLSCLIAVESKTSACTFHDYAWAESTEDTGLVVLSRVELRCGGIVRIGKATFASRADSFTACGIGKAQGIGACNAENVTISTVSEAQILSWGRRRGPACM